MSIKGLKGGPPETGSRITSSLIGYTRPQGNPSLCTKRGSLTLGLRQHDAGNSIFNNLKVSMVAYMAPEVVRGVKAGNPSGYSWTADVCSIGMVCSEIPTGKLSFQDFSRPTSENKRPAVRLGQRL